MARKHSEAEKVKDREYDQKRRGKRTRNWAFLLYPESCVTEWREVMGQMCVPAFVSPLHDQDVWTAYDEQENENHKQGEPKKSHYHVMLMFSSVKTYQQVMEKVEQLGGTSCVPIEDVKAYARYLCHTGQKDKAQYNSDDVLQFGGADYAETVEGTGDKVKVIAEMEEFIEQQGIDSYHALSRYARQNRPDWYRVLVWNGRHLKDVMQAMTWERNEQAKAMAAAAALERECRRDNEGDVCDGKE